MALVGHSVTLFGNVGVIFKVYWCLYVKIRVTGHENQKSSSGQITPDDPKKQKKDQNMQELNNPSREPLPPLTIWCFEDSLRFDRSQPYPQHTQLPRATGPGEMKGLTASEASTTGPNDNCEPRGA